MHTTAQINIPRAMVQMRSVIELLLPEFVLVGEPYCHCCRKCLLLNHAEHTPSLFRFLTEHTPSFFRSLGGQNGVVHSPNVLRSVAHCRIVLTGSRWVEGS